MTEEPDESIEPDVVYERLSAEDVVTEIRTLLASAANYARLRSIAAALCAGLNDQGADDLLNEAVVRFYEGRRKWPRGVHPLVVFKAAMHSITSDARKRKALSPIDEGVALATAGSEADTGDVQIGRAHV